MDLLSDRKVLEILRSTGAMMDGHFLLSSGKHSASYIQCAKLFQFPGLAQQVCSGLVERSRRLGHIDAVVGPALGGIIIAYELVRALDVRGMFTEREDGEMVLRRGFKIEPGERILIAEDVVTTGRTSLEVARVVRACGGEVAGVACVVDRMPEDKEVSLPLISATKMQIELYEPDDCPLCRQGIPLVKPGSRKARLLTVPETNTLKSGG